MKVNAIRIERTGAPGVMDWRPTELQKPKEGEVLLRHTVAGVNFIDTYQRSGLNKVPVPGGLGVEGAGVIEELGPGVREFRIGDRVCYPGSKFPGSYSEARIIETSSLVRIPDGVSDEMAAALSNKGMTAEYLVRRCFKVRPDQFVLVHAAAGGTGQVLGQWLNAIDAIAIGTAGGPEKCAVASRSGYSFVIDYNNPDWVAEVIEYTRGAGVSVVYDTVGKATWQGSLSVLHKRGHLISVGNASGPVDGFRLNVLSEKGSLYVTRPTLQDYIGTRKELLSSARLLFSMIKAGKVKADIGQRFRMSESRLAHEALEGRRTIGTTILVP